MAIEGVFAMIDHDPAQVAEIVPQLIFPIKAALSTRDPDVQSLQLRVLKRMLESHEDMGPALLPYYRQILVPVSRYYGKNINIGDKIDYGQRKKANVANALDDLLPIMEEKGGQGSFELIKYMIPLYESVVYR
eukprot:GHVU01060659.1.p2 GENE.GHVU01060659.1~~GHVU01060659.1.p2  ORF type:complete len:133 (+),score=19.80 GHVU01060659.1:690-1088(+)